MNHKKPAVSTSCGRNDDRYEPADTWLDWTDATGRMRTFQVLDLSRGGLCLGVVSQDVELPEGSELNGAVLRIEGVKICGRVIVAQSTESLSRGPAYGGAFYPTSADDEARFHAVIVEFERRFQRKALV
jgi:hypothetical protein